MAWLPSFKDLIGPRPDEREELLLFHSFSKGLLEEIKHARRGLELSEIGHVRNELGDVLEALEHREDLHGYVGGSRRARELRERLAGIAVVLEQPEAHMHPRVREALDELDEHAHELHDTLHFCIAKHRVGDDAAFRPPHHR